jgi:hypothetical protein
MVVLTYGRMNATICDRSRTWSSNLVLCSVATVSSLFPGYVGSMSASVAAVSSGFAAYLPKKILMSLKRKKRRLEKSGTRACSGQTP